MAPTRASRYAAWLDNNRVGLVVLAVLIAIAGGYLASRMKVAASLTNLLPQEQRSVRDLNAIQKRARPFGTVQILLESTDVAKRERAGQALAAKLGKLPSSLVAQLNIDDGPRDRYAWTHRFLFAELADLEAGRDALRARIERGKLEANPLFISLDDQAAPDRDRFDELETELSELERRALSPQPRVSKDGRSQLIVVQTTFPASDARRANELIGGIRRAIGEVRRETGPGVRYGLTGNITLSMYEHDSVLDGMALSAIVTVILVGLGLMLYYGSGRIVLSILLVLGVGVAATFAVAWATIGSLNVMTTFLFAIVIGNGINAGMIVAARYLEEVRAGGDPRTSVGVALGSTVRGTLAATATAAVAYTSLLVSDFRGFQQFGVIAGIGMVLTWVAAYTILPCVLFVLARAGLLERTRPWSFANRLANLIPEYGYGRVLVVGGAVTMIALTISIRYIANDPFTNDWRDLQSKTASLDAARVVDAKIKAAFDSGSMLAGQAYQLVIAVERREQVAPLVARLTAEDALRPADQRWIRDVKSLDDALPKQQPEKLAVLAEIRALIDDPALQATLSDPEESEAGERRRAGIDRTRLAKLRPPDDLRAVTDADVPVELGWPFIERDGTRGRLVIVRGAARFTPFDVDARLAFAAEVRAMQLPAGVLDGALVAGEALVVADIIETMEGDAPQIIAISLVGSLLTVILVLGIRRHGLVTIACGLAGVVLMIAVCSLLGVKVHFLDLIALPITIGIGIDYAVNLVARDRQDSEGERGPRHLVRTIGSTVLVCSYTTSVGYGTLMLSANGGIRSFGLAALVGEVSCIVMALIVAPACLAALRQRDRRRQTER